MRHRRYWKVCAAPDSFAMEKAEAQKKPQNKHQKKPPKINRHLRAMASMGQEEKIKYLCGMAAIKFQHKGNYWHKRKAKNPPTGRCDVCGEIATCRHHVILLINGGKNSKKNLINICGVCHARVHDWLSVKETAEIKRMNLEFRGVCAPCQ